MKRPFELVVSTARALGADVDDAGPLVGWVATHRRTALSMPAANGLLGQVGSLGQYRCAAQPAELRDRAWRAIMSEEAKCS